MVSVYGASKFYRIVEKIIIQSHFFFLVSKFNNNMPK